METNKLRISGFYETSCTNGEGWRSVIFFSGCPHHCKGCHNPTTWNFSSGEEVTVDELFERIKDASDFIDGVTFSGGEPFQERHVDALLILINKIKSLGLNIWSYTGYTYEILKDNSNFEKILNEIDYLVDGPFVKELMDPELKFRGSSNQRILKLK